MLLPAELRTWAERIGLDAPALDVIQQVRTGDPVRRPRSGTRNTAGRWPSRKMGVTISYESGHVERSAIVLMEHGSTVLEFYEQPLVLSLDYLRKGRRVVVLYTPDFLVLEREGAFLDEWKTEEELVRLAERMPERYQRGPDGWVAPPAAEAAGRLGLRFRVRSASELPAVLVRNVSFLRDHLADAPAADGSPNWISILDRVRVEPGVSAGTLLADATCGGADVLWPLIAHGVIWADPADVPFAEPDRVRLFLDAAQAAAWDSRALPPDANGRIQTGELMGGAAVEWDGRPWHVVNAGIEEVVLEDDRGTFERVRREEVVALIIEGRLTVADSGPRSRLAPAAVERLRGASPAALSEANRRFAILRGNGAASERTRSRWQKAYREAELVFGWGYIGLIPDASNGNGRPRREQTVYELMDEVIEEKHLVPGAPLPGHAYGALVDRCIPKGLTPPSPSTFRRRIELTPRHERDLPRLGRRAAYASQPFHFYLGQDTPPHGDYPWQIVHIDHTQLDIEILSRDGRRRLGRPWLTLMMDAFSRRVLAFWLTFDPPSYRSDMMAMRVTVKPHNRLGELYVVDGGADFESVWFEQLLARYEVEKKSRPAAQARFGGVIERLFGVSNTELIWNLPGNTKATRNVRSLTPKVDPRRLAPFDLGTLHDLLYAWFYELYDGREHAALGRSPRDAYTDGMTAAGSRPARLIPYDADFVRDTMPSTAKGTLRVRPGAGVRLHHAHYWHPDFALAGVEGSDVAVRWDPFDLRHLYAYVGHHWVEAIASSRVSGPALTEREHHLAVEELRQRDRLAGQTAAVSERRLATYLASEGAAQQLAAQRAADGEVRRVADGLEVVDRDLELDLDVDIDDDEEVEEPLVEQGEVDRGDVEEQDQDQEEDEEPPQDRRPRADRPIELGPYK